MPQSRITLRRIPYEEPYHIRLQFTATNGIFSGFLEYYCNVEELQKVGLALSSFPRYVNDEFRYEIGSTAPETRWAYHFVLRAYTLNSRGNCAIEVIINNNQELPSTSSCTFSIMVDPAALNRLGKLYLLFADLKHNEFDWTETEEIIR